MPHFIGNRSPMLARHRPPPDLLGQRRGPPTLRSTLASYSPTSDVHEVAERQRVIRSQRAVPQNDCRAHRRGPALSEVALRHPRCKVTPKSLTSRRPVEVAQKERPFFRREALKHRRGYGRAKDKVTKCR